ncbi:MAG: DNA cytosine methyltransferase [Oscillochloridaceae bacterium umkhey_bin13]
MPTIQSTYTVASLFSGCGGMDLGFRGDFTFLATYYERLPFEIVWANEINEAACRTYRRNLDERIVCGDVWDFLHEVPRNVDVLIGGFPCQDISINGKGAGINGKRSGLYRAMVEAVRLAKPKIFIAENVKGLLMRHNQASLEKILEDFHDLGYKVSYKLYHAANYGVPQSRERVFIVGTIDHDRKFMPPTEIVSKDNWISAQAAIGDLETLASDPRINHIWSLANRSPDQGNRQLDASKPGHTIRAECHGNIQYHYRLPRRISMREAARIQSFPDDFIFEAKLRETERQIGNAVPPVLAWHMARAVQRYLEKGA